MSCHGEQIPQEEPSPLAARGVVVEPSLWGVLVADSDIVHVAAGELIYEAGQVPAVFAILSGTARVFMWSARGRQVTLRYAGQSELIGLGPRLAGVDVTSAEAVSDVAAATLPLDGVRRVATANPGLAWALTEQVAGWAAEAVRSLSDVAPLPMTARVATHLLQVSMPTPTAISAQITHQRLADAVGTAREVVSRALGQLRRAGVVETWPGQIVITDRRGWLSSLVVARWSAIETTGCDSSHTDWCKPDRTLASPKGTASNREPRRNTNSVSAS